MVDIDYCINISVVNTLMQRIVKYYILLVIKKHMNTAQSKLLSYLVNVNGYSFFFFFFAELAINYMTVYIQGKNQPN